MQSVRVKLYYWLWKSFPWNQMQKQKECFTFTVWKSTRSNLFSQINPLMTSLVKTLIWRKKIRFPWKIVVAFYSIFRVCNLFSRIFPWKYHKHLIYSYIRRKIWVKCFNFHEFYVNPTSKKLFNLFSRIFPWNQIEEKL